MFAKMHHHHRHKLIIALSTTTPGKFSTFDLEAPQDGLTVSRPLPFEANYENLLIIVSVRGLVCLRMIKNSNGREYSDIIIWNPLTGEYRTVSRPNNEQCYVTTATFFQFYYSCNDYKLLLVTEDHDVYIFSLKYDSWRKVETTQEEFNCLHSHWHLNRLGRQPCVLLNEKMYFLTIQSDMDSKGGNLIIIIRFDTKTEKWRKIAGPYSGNGIWKKCLSFLVARGCIHLYLAYFNQTDDGKYIKDDLVAELWRMDADGDGDEYWTKVVVTCKQPNSFPPWFTLYPLHLKKNGNWVMHDEFLQEIHEADLKMRTTNLVYSYYPKSILITPKGKYIETLGINMFN